MTAYDKFKYLSCNPENARLKHANYLEWFAGSPPHPDIQNCRSSEQDGVVIHCPPILWLWVIKTM